MGRRPLLAYSAIALVLSVIYVALPTPPRALWTAIGLLSVLAVVVGVVRHRPRRRLAWWLVAAGILTFVVGDLTYDLLTGPLGFDNPFPSVADVLYLCMYPLLAGGLLLCVRGRSYGRDREALLDALIATVAMGLALYIVLVAPYAADRSSTWLEKSFSIAYPLGDLLLLSVLVRLLVGGGRQLVSLRLLTVGTLALTASDILYGLSQLGGSWQTGGLVDIGWLTFYAAWGAAALHPDMVLLTEPVRLPPSTTSSTRLTVLGLVSVMPPTVLVVEGVRGDHRHVLVTALACAATFALVAMRFGSLVGVARESTRREALLRRTGEVLVGAPDRSHVYAATADAILLITHPPDRHRVLIGAGCPDLCELVHDSAAKTGSLPHDPERGALATLVQRHDAQLRVHSFVLTRSDREGGILAERLGPGVPVLLVADLRAGEVAGIVAVAGDEVERADLIDAVCAVTAQMSLALETADLVDLQQAALTLQERSKERARIARDMHDTLAHRMSLVGMYAGALSYRSDLSSAEMREIADVIKSGANDALTDLRDVLGVLRAGDEKETSGGRPQPGIADLRTLVDEVQRAGMDVELDSTFTGEVSEQVGGTIYRMVQEGLTNVRKHAPTACAHVTLAAEDGGVRVTVHNLITSALRTSTPGAGLGLVGLAERVSLAGGRLGQRWEDGGFTLTAWFPA